jgi:indolepyruvate ferredoxin oxidoreductase beta subunit
MAEHITNIALIGTGGQGALTIMEMLALAAEIADLEIRVLSRVSLARLGNAGICHIRLGPTSSPAIPAGEADILVTLEMSEVLRILPLARPGAQAFINTFQRLPIAAGVAGRAYPSQSEIADALAASGVHPRFIPTPLPTDLPIAASELADRANMVMLGVLCGACDLLPRAVLEEAIALRLPSFAEQNLRIFDAGWRFAQS